VFEAVVLTDREFRLRVRIDELLDQRDAATKRADEARARAVRWRERAYALTRSRDLWRNRARAWR
jgi:hypothetical protein